MEFSAVTKAISTVKTVVPNLKPFIINRGISPPILYMKVNTNVDAVSFPLSFSYWRLNKNCKPNIITDKDSIP